MVRRVSGCLDIAPYLVWNLDDRLYVGTNTGNLHIYKLSTSQGASLSLLEDCIWRWRENTAQMRLKDRQLRYWRQRSHL